MHQNGHLEGTHRSPADAVLLPDWVNALTVRRGLAGAGGGMGVGVGAEVIVAGCKDAGIYAMQWEGGDVGEEGGGGGLVKTKALVVQKCDGWWCSFDIWLPCIGVCLPTVGREKEGKGKMDEGRVRGGKRRVGWGRVG